MNPQINFNKHNMWQTLDLKIIIIGCIQVSFLSIFINFQVKTVLFFDARLILYLFFADEYRQFTSIVESCNSILLKCEAATASCFLSINNQQDLNFIPFFHIFFIVKGLFYFLYSFYMFCRWSSSFTYTVPNLNVVNLI